MEVWPCGQFDILGAASGNADCACISLSEASKLTGSPLPPAYVMAWLSNTRLRDFNENNRHNET